MQDVPVDASTVTALLAAMSLVKSLSHNDTLNPRFL